MNKFMETKAFLGIDVSKGYADFVLINSAGENLEKSFRLFDDRQGHKKLQELINQWKEMGLQEIYCGVESTGGYENNWYSLLKGLQSRGEVQASRLNPRAVKAVSDAVLRRTITDAVSAENIALYLAKFSEKINYGGKYTGSREFKDGRDHLTAIQMQIKQRSQLSNQLGMWLYGSFSEVVIYCRNGIPNWLLRMLVKYPTAEKVVNARTGLSEIRGISKEKAASLKIKAGQSSQHVSPQMAHIISVTASEILHKTDLIESEEAYLTDIYKDNPEVGLLITIPAVGKSSAVKFALEIEDVNRFEDAKKMASYFGVHPTFKQSGDGKWGSHMSKRGRGVIRSALYMCALTGTRHNPILKQLYTRCRSKGMSHKAAAGVLMHKLLRMIYGILKSGKPFDEKVDESNRNISSQKEELRKSNLKEKNKEESKKLYRYQSLKVAGPISGRKAAKIKKQTASQSSTEEASTGLLSANTNL